MPADRPCHHARVAEMVEPARPAVALTRGEDQREVRRGVRGQESVLERGGEVFGEADADEAAGDDGVAG